MSVLKANQKPSPFEVEHHAYKIRTVITDLALRKFGLKEYAEKPKPETYSKWSQQQKDGYDKSVAKNKERYEAFIEWFIPDEQKSILDLCRNMIHEIFLANEIYPQHLCECDERRLHQDLAIGYCENLIQELQYGITTLHVNIEKYEMFARIDIKDSGVGIPEEEIPKIFRRFYRGINVLNEEGIGIGLYLSREIITKQNGYIKVSSSQKGSIFSIFLPNE